MKKYKCTRDFRVGRFDENGHDTDSYMEVEAGSVWIVDEKANFIGGEVHLKNPEKLEWLELSKERLEELFEEVKEGE